MPPLSTPILTIPTVEPESSSIDISKDPCEHLKKSLVIVNDHSETHTCSSTDDERSSIDSNIDEGGTERVIDFREERSRVLQSMEVQLSPVLKMMEQAHERIFKSVEVGKESREISELMILGLRRQEVPKNITS